MFYDVYDVFYDVCVFYDIQVNFLQIMFYDVYDVFYGVFHVFCDVQDP